MQACDRCHSRKTRCDRRIPKCTSCEKARAACLHVDKLRQRNVPRGYVDSVEDQVQRLVNENDKLRRELSALRNNTPLSDGNGAATHHNGRGGGSDGPDPPDQAFPSPNSPTSWHQNGAGDSQTSTTVPRHQQQSNTTATATAAPAPTAAIITAAPTTSNNRAGSHDEASTQPQTAEVAQRANEDPVTTEVGYLSLKATGETRYLGSSSGIGLAAMISAIIDAHPGPRLVPTDPRDGDANGGMSVAAPPCDSSIPSLHAAKPFIDAYFQHTHITFPLLHRTSFLHTVECIYTDPDYYASHTYEAFVFDMVLSIGSSNVNRFGDSSTSSALHYARAQAKLSAVLGMSGLLPVRAILLLSQHGIFCNLKDTSASIWHLVGIGVRICFEMGLHVEPRLQASSRSPATHVTLEEELKRRCFWCLYNLDRVVSFTLGRPAAIRDDDINVQLPSALDDDDFGTERPIALHQSAGRQSSPFLHLIRIRRLSGQIHATLYSPKQSSELSYDEKRRVRQGLHKEIVAWREDTGLLDLTSRSADGGSLASSFLCPEWYTAVYNNAMLLLYRPSPSFPHPMNSAHQNDEAGDLLQLFTAAKTSINAYSELHRKRLLNYSWITLHGVFIAGLAYVYCIGRALKDSSPASNVPDYLEIIDDTRACSNVLVAICERWNVVRRSCELFNRLSTAVIRDAVNAATKRNSMPHSWEKNNAGYQESRESYSAMNANEGQVQMSGGETNDYSFLANNQTMHDNTLIDHAFVVDEFRHYSGGFDSGFAGDEVFPSELVMGFSHDWPFGQVYPPQSEFGLLV